MRSFLLVVVVVVAVVAVVVVVSLTVGIQTPEFPCHPGKLCSKPRNVMEDQRAGRNAQRGLAERHSNSMTDWSMSFLYNLSSLSRDISNADIISGQIIIFHQPRFA